MDQYGSLDALRYILLFTSMFSVWFHDETLELKIPLKYYILM